MRFKCNSCPNPALSVVHLRCTDPDFEVIEVVISENIIKPVGVISPAFAVHTVFHAVGIIFLL